MPANQNLNFLNTRITQGVSSGTVRAMDLKERAKLMHELYPELSELLSKVARDYIDQALCKEQLIRIRDLLRLYEGHPANVGDAFMAILWKIEKAAEGDVAHSNIFSSIINDSFISNDSTSSGVESGTPGNYGIGPCSAD